MQSMDDLFFALLQDVYCAEKEQLALLATLAEKSSNATLKLAFRDHEDETLEQVARLEEVFEILGREPQAGGLNPEAMNSGAMNSGAMNSGAVNSGAMNSGAMNSGAINSGTMTAIAGEARRIAADTTDPAVRDAGMVAACQALEHYEVARYGTLVAWAEHLAEDDVVDLLAETLEEEQHADELLSSIAEGGVNASACERPAAMQEV